MGHNSVYVTFSFDIWFVILSMYMKLKDNSDLSYVLQMLIRNSYISLHFTKLYSQLKIWTVIACILKCQKTLLWYSTPATWQKIEKASFKSIKQKTSHYQNKNIYNTLVEGLISIQYTHVVATVFLTEMMYVLQML